MIWDADCTANDVAALVPKWTALVLPSPVPVIVTVWPPPSEPELGEMPVTSGTLPLPTTDTLSSSWLVT